MSEFSNVKIGEAGMHLIELSASMSKPLVFTKCEIGDGISDGSTRTELISKKMTAPITRVAEVANADVSEARNVLYFAYSNDGIAEGDGFSATEIGIYAKVSSDSYTDSGWGGYKGEETFYGYAYAVDAKHGEWIPDKTYKMDVQEFAIYTSVGNASSVGVEITSDVYAREEDFEYHLTDPEAHSDFKGCSDASSGVRGFVPAPKAGDGKKFLSATGGWERAGHSPLELYDLIYPVGIVVEFENSTDPNSVFPGTTWIVTQKGQVAVGAGDYWENGTKYTYTLGDTGGEVKHPLSAVSLAVGGLVGYVVAYVTGLRAVRKGMQLILRASLNDMYVRFQRTPPTVDEKQVFEEMYEVYERLADNGIMTAKHEEVLKMPEEVRK